MTFSFAQRSFLTSGAVGLVAAALWSIAPVLAYALPPTVGALALLAAVLRFGNLYGLRAVALVFGVGQLVESLLLTPRLVGERAELR